MIIAIDGPAGAGKSTIARKVAARLGFQHVDTGAFYRAVVREALEAGALEDPDRVAQIAADLDIHFNGAEVFSAGQDVTAAIRSPRVSQAVSKVAALGEVRRALVPKQRALGLSCERGAVLDGRDIGTAVFPDADLKIYLTASEAVRAARRAKELEAAGKSVDVAAVQAGIARRDTIDSTRDIDPLVEAADAVHLDTTDLGIDAVVEKVCALAAAHASKA